jgi:hypothetical protein
MLARRTLTAAASPRSVGRPQNRISVTFVRDVSIRVSGFAHEDIAPAFEMLKIRAEALYGECARAYKFYLASASNEPQRAMGISRDLA